jgi:hypothetical protein
VTAATILLDVPRVLVVVICCVLTPLALRVANLPRLARFAIQAGAVAGGAQFMATSYITACATLPYTVICVLAALAGVRRLLLRWAEPSQLAMAAALVALGGASIWLFCFNAGIALLGYPPLWVLLTAAHFHVAGCFLALVVGWCTEGRTGPAGLVAIGCVIGVPLTAVGIAGPHWLEVAAATTMAASGIGAALVILTTSSARPAIAVVRLSALPLATGMVLALMYALRDRVTAFTFAGLDPLSSMIASHAILDTLFALLALAALARLGHRIREAPPLSRLRGTWPVGATFFARAELELSPSKPPTGLVDRVEDLGVTTVAHPIREFYERTGSQELVVRPHWRLGFRTGGRVWAAFARRMGQLQLPVHAESGSEGIASRIVALDARGDGRSRPRAWIRTYPDGRALYVAAYSTHERDRAAYMNIAFPVPGGQLSSVLRMVRRGDGVRVSTRFGGDCGIWLVLFGLPLRLPLSETIDVWTVEDRDAPEDLRTWAKGSTTIARHTLWLFGVRYLALDYAMRRADAS